MIAIFQNQESVVAESRGDEFLRVGAFRKGGKDQKTKGGKLLSIDCLTNVSTASISEIGDGQALPYSIESMHHKSLRTKDHLAGSQNEWIWLCSIVPRGLLMQA